MPNFLPSLVSRITSDINRPWRSENLCHQFAFPSVHLVIAALPHKESTVKIASFSRQTILTLWHF